MDIIAPKYDSCMMELFANETIRKHFIANVLWIPVEKIISARPANTYWVRFFNTKNTED